MSVSTLDNIAQPKLAAASPHEVESHRTTFSEGWLETIGELTMIHNSLQSISSRLCTPYAHFRFFSLDTRGGVTFRSQQFMRPLHAAI
jgi:hypothetical protein